MKSGPAIANPEMFGGQYLKGEPKKGKGRRSPLAASSENQDARSAFLMGVKYERLRSQSAAGPPLAPPYRCESCKRGYQRLEEALEGLDLHHVAGRRGVGYRRGKGPGVDNPQGLRLICRCCHDIEHKKRPPVPEGPLDAA